MGVNRQLLLAKRPVGEPAPDDFEVREEELAAPGDGEALVKVLQISLDPAMRGWMRDTPSYVPPVGLGEVMRAGTTGVVVESNSDKLAPGDFVVGMLGVQEQGVAPDSALTKVDTNVAPLETYLGGLGMPGLTAYFGLTEVGDLKEGDTVVISGAAGAVGSASPVAPTSARGSSTTSASMPQSITRARVSAVACTNCSRTASTSTSTTSAARSWTRRWRTWRGARAWSSAARSPSTTPRTACGARATT
jgi:N-terminal domain of oxidoreductase